MTTLLAYLTAHGLHHVVTLPTHHAYATISHYCRVRNYLTGWAQFKNRVVAYCYPSSWK